MQYNLSLIIQKIISNYRPGMVPVIYGPTATGKTKLSLELAKEFKKRYNQNVEIISADSRQVYREMNIGTDKIGQDIRDQIIHHQIDIIDPDQSYTAGQRQQDTYRIVDEIIWRWNIAMIVWGTGLYIDTVVYNFNMGICEPDREYRKLLSHYDASLLWNKLNEVDPVEAARHHPSSDRFIIRALEIYHKTGVTKTELVKRQEPKYPLLMIWLQQDPFLGNTMIDERLEKMIQEGLILEVQGLLDKWYNCELSSMKTIDYKQTVDYLQWKLNYEEYRKLLKIANHQLAKKQRTWFRRYERDNLGLFFFLPDYIIE